MPCHRVSPHNSIVAIPAAAAASQSKSITCELLFMVWMKPKAWEDLANTYEVVFMCDQHGLRTLHVLDIMALKWSQFIELLSRNSLSRTFWNWLLMTIFQLARFNAHANVKEVKNVWNWSTHYGKVMTKMSTETRALKTFKTDIFLLLKKSIFHQRCHSSALRIFASKINLSNA